MTDISKAAQRETKAKEHQITVGELRKELEGLNDDCVISFGSEDGQLFYCRYKPKKRDSSNNPTLISFELSTAENVLDDLDPV